MRRWAAVLVVAALLGGAALGFAGPTSSAQAAEDGDRRIKIVIHNEGPDHIGEEGEATLNLTRIGDGVVYETRLDIPPGESFNKTLYQPAGDYWLQVEFRMSSEGELGSTHARTGTGDIFATYDCPGLYQSYTTVEYEASRSDGSISLSTSTSSPYEENGCFAVPPGFEDLKGEADGVLDSPPSGESIHVPLPRVGDRGEIRSGPVSTNDPAADDIVTAFRWRNLSDFPDAWGRPTDGFQIQSEERWRGLLKPGWRNHTRLMMWRTDELHPFAATHGWSRTASSSSSTVRDDRSEERQRRLRYGPFSFSGCRYRFPLQGTTVAEGQEIPVAELCGDEDDNRTLVVGEIVERDGLRLAPAYSVIETDERTMVTRLWLADGIPYIAGRESYSLHDDGRSFAQAQRLARYGEGAEPLPRPTDDVRSPGQADLAPIDPLSGPAAGDAADRFT